MSRLASFRKPDSSGLLGNRDFATLWTGETISIAGFHVTALAMQLTATLTLGASAVQMGVLVAAESAPNLLFGLLAGVWVDRLRRRPILMAADFLRAVVLLSIPLAWWLGLLQMGQLYVVVFIIACGTTFFDVAYLTYLPSLVRPEHILEGNSKLQASSSVMNIAGPNLAGVLVQALTAPVALIVDALSYLCSAAFIGRIDTPEPRAHAASRTSTVWAEIREGLRALLGEPVLRAITWAGVDFALSNSMRGALSVLYITRSLGVSPAVLGAIYGAGGVGSLCGALLATRIADRLGVGRTIISVYAVFGAATLLAPAAHFAPDRAVIAMLMLGLFGSSFAGTVWSVNGKGLQQSIPPQRLLGRINASSRFLYMASMPLGALAGGALGSRLGLWQTLTVASFGIIVATPLLARSPVRAVRTLPISAGAKAR